MSNSKKRVYKSESRKAQALKTRQSLFEVATQLFEEVGFEKVTIEVIAQAAHVSPSTIYSLFKSKLGILRALLDEALPPEEFWDLVKEAKQSTQTRQLEITAKISRRLYDAEKAQMALIAGASTLDPDFKKLEMEREERRYDRQDETARSIAQQNRLGLKQTKDLLWLFSGRDLYRMLVIERRWSSDAYEKWLAEHLKQTLL